MNPKASILQNNPPLVIVDTNIFGNLFDKYTNSDTFNIVDGLSKKYTMAISKITVMEVTAFGSKNVVKILRTFSAFKKFEIDDEVLSFAGLIFCTKKVRGQNDCIIASTTFLNNAYLLTSNQKDFPEPFFHETNCWHIHHKDKENRTMTEHIYLLQVDPVKIGKDLSNIEYVQEIAKKKAVKNSQ